MKNINSQGDHIALLKLRDLLRQHLGIVIRDEKLFLLENRLKKNLRSLKMSSFSEYLNVIKTDPRVFEEFVSTMTTHKTFFFREKNSLSILESSIPTLGKDIVYILCGACSTGEEAYSLAAVLEKMKATQNFDYRILATDVCERSIQTAIQGHYTLGKEQIVDNGHSEYFEFASGHFSPKMQLRERIKFRKMNLVDMNLPQNIRFDFVFLRNVLIYFDDTSIKKTIDFLSKHQDKGGKLVIGMSEHIENNHYKAVGGSIYDRVA